MKKLFITVLAAALMLAASLCSAEMAYPQGVDWQSGTVEADGYGAPPNSGNPAQVNILARRAAVIDAYRNLLEVIQGVNIDSSTTVENAMVQNDTLKSQVTGFLKGARVIKENWTPEGAYHVVVAVPLYGKNSLSTIVAPRIRADEQQIPGYTANYAPGNSGMSTAIPAQPQQPNATVIVTFSGIIIDCRNTSIEETMAPTIYDEDGRVVYGSRNVSNDILINKGLCSYVAADSTDYSRAGNNPINAAPMMLKDYNRNIVINRADGNKILSANQQYNFLSSAAVVVLVN